MQPTTPTATTGATISYTASAYDTLPGICSRFFVQTGYASLSSLMDDTVTLNPGISDWSISLAGKPVTLPTVKQ